MKKQIELLFAFLMPPIDFIMILTGIYSAYFLRYQEFITEVRPILFDLSPQHLFTIGLLFTPLWILMFAWFGLYTTRRIGFIQEFSKITQACTISIMLITTYMVFIREIFSSRFIILFAWVFSILFVLLGRILIRIIKNILRHYGIGVRKTIIIGDNHATRILTKLFTKQKSLGIFITKIFEYDDHLLSNLSEHSVDMIIQTDTQIPRKTSADIIDYCQKNHLIYQYVGGDFESKVTNNEVHTFAGIPIIEIKRTPLDGWGKILKRLIDIIGAIFCIILTLPIMLIIAIIIKFTSNGPIFADTPNRAGQYLTNFRMYKFRSMYQGAHKDQGKYSSERAGLFKLSNDPRITPLGKILRKTSLDEIPQFFNVLKGEMSLVGPRPHFPHEYQDNQERVLDIKPGITGIAQISGRSDLSFQEEIKLDLFYIENWSLWLDIWIILKTPIILFTKINSAI